MINSMIEIGLEGATLTLAHCQLCTESIPSHRLLQSRKACQVQICMFSSVSCSVIKITAIIAVILDVSANLRNMLVHGACMF